MSPKVIGKRERGAPSPISQLGDPQGPSVGTLTSPLSRCLPSKDINQTLNRKKGGGEVRHPQDDNLIY